jgi:tryptophan synthase beta chain
MIKVLLNEDEIPRQWYNLAADLPTPMLPPLGPDGNPVSPDALAPVFAMPLIEQEVSQKRWIDIPEEVLEILYRWRPSPLHRATFLEKALKTPARIYFKKVFHRQEATNQIRQCPRPGTTSSQV